jgi:hypothetical protein
LDRSGVAQMFFEALWDEDIIMHSERWRGSCVRKPYIAESVDGGGAGGYTLGADFFKGLQNGSVDT